MIAREITDNAVPDVNAPQTWEENINVGEAEDAQLRLLWNSNVPGSHAPESIMLAAIQAKENRGYVVENGVELWLKGQEAVKRGDMVALNRISVQLWTAVNMAKEDHQHESRKFKRYLSWENVEQAVNYPPAKPVSAEGLAEKMRAGWMAQIAGGALGTMIEGYTTDMLRKTFGEVRGYQREPNTYNDDITYELVFLKACEMYGKKALTSEQIAQEWLAYVPNGWSAEEMAIRNIRWGLMPPYSGMLANPFSEWIGAQMRGAICGMVAPGDVKEAARLAWMDGEVSHFNNGILGEVFNAMLVSFSFVEQDMRKIVSDCVDLIPHDSEYYSVVNFALEQCKSHDNWEAAWRPCEKRLEKYNWIHAYPNAAAEVIALWFGQGDFDETAYIIAMEGQDVDCNAAQILTALGIMQGMEGIPARWTDPIGDDLNTYLRQDRLLSIRELSERTAKVALS